MVTQQRGDSQVCAVRVCMAVDESLVYSVLSRMKEQ